MSQPDRKKPVKLQLNNSGSWKDVIRFDAADDASCDEISNAADLLGRHDASQHVKFRVVTEAAYPMTLTTWTRGVGWTPAHGGSLK